MGDTRFLVLALSGAAFAGCGGGGGGGGGSGSSDSPPTPVQTPDPPPAAPAFVDATAASGIAYASGYVFPPAEHWIGHFSTSGAAAGDYDSDGDIDLLIVRGDIGPNLLYRNNGAGVFTDVAASAGLAYTATVTESYRHSGPGFADMDGDGDLDVFLGGVFGDPSLLFANNGDGTFSDVTAGSGIDTMLARHSVAAAFGDYDLDGDLDMFVSHWGTARDMQNPGDTEHLWRNDSDGGVIRFTSVSVPAGISPSILTLPDPGALVADLDYTFTASFARINDDLYPDLVVVADYNQSMVFMNAGDGTFDNVTDVGVITDSNGMGSALGDYDDDGDLDWFVTSIFGETSGDLTPGPHTGNKLYRNDGGSFVDVSAEAGVASGGWGWGACFMDFENDGDLDIYHTNGGRADFTDDASRAFVANGGGHFTERAAALGLDDTQQGRGVICADFDGDGDIDILQQHRDFPVAATLWRNTNSGGNNYLGVRLNGRAPNTEAAGARIYASIGARTMMREVIIGNNFESQNPATQHFGLGSFSQVDELRVQWPDGTETIETAVPAGQVLALNQP